MTRTCFLFVLFLMASAALAQDSTIAQQQPLPDSLRTIISDDSLDVSHTLFAFDSTLIKGSKYGSFADLFDLLPGTYLYDRGSVGQLAEGFLFGGTPGSFTLDYDGLILNDLLTGKVDLNMVPTEGVDKIRVLLVPGKGSSFFSPAGQTLRIDPVDLASLPIRSRVAYRTGTGYDDNDVRLGIQASPVLKINAGGILKNYAGTLRFSKYRAQKVNVKVERTLGTWQLDYLLLMNKSDLDIPFVDREFSGGNFRLPHRKDVRYDHALSLHRGRFRTILQYTDLKREFYGYRHSVIDLVHKVKNIRLESEYSIVRSFAALDFAARYNFVHLNSNGWGKQSRWVMEFVARAQKNLAPGWQVSAKSSAKLSLDFDLLSDYQLSSRREIWPGISLSSWISRAQWLPSLEALYSKQYIRNGLLTLRPETLNQVGAALELSRSKVKLFIVHTAQRLDKQIVSQRDTREFGPGLYFPFIYRNMNSYWRYSFDLYADYYFWDWLSMTNKLKYMHNFENINLVNQPDFFWQGYIKLAHYFTKYEVDAQLRIGGQIIGPYAGASSLFQDIATEYEEKGWQFYPYLHAIFEISDVTLFGALLNPLNLDYGRAYNFPYPKAQLRWGFSWNFID